MDKVPGVYRITSPSGRFYIGSAKNMRKRMNEHIGHMRRQDHFNQMLNNASKKHGVESMQFGEVCRCPPGFLREIERTAIEWLEPEYNLTKETNQSRQLEVLWTNPDFRARGVERTRKQSTER